MSSYITSSLYNQYNYTKRHIYTHIYIYIYISSYRVLDRGGLPAGRGIGITLMPVAGSTTMVPVVNVCVGGGKLV